jgi:hypothetical protein
MDSNSPAMLAEILRTTLYLVEQRQDLDQEAPSVSQLKESMRRTIAEIEEKRKTPESEVVDNAARASWSDILRKKIRR